MSVYCVRTDLDSIFSQFGIDVRVDDDDDASLDAAEDVYIDDAIDQASSWVDQFLGGRYSSSVLAGNRFVRWATATLAVVIVCRHRGNSPPESLASAAENYLEQLKAIAAGETQLIGASGPEPVVAALPRVSNLTIDFRHFWGNIRRVRATSVEKSPLPPNDASLFPFYP